MGGVPAHVWVGACACCGRQAVRHSTMHSILAGPVGWDGGPHATHHSRHAVALQRVHKGKAHSAGARAGLNLHEIRERCGLPCIARTSCPWTAVGPKGPAGAPSPLTLADAFVHEMSNVT